VFSLFGCASLGTQKNIDRDGLIGQWVEVVVKGNENWVTHSEYLADGRKCTLGLSLNNKGEVSASYYESVWSLDGNRISAKVKKTSSKYVDVNEVIVDEVLAVDKNRIVIQMIKPIRSSSQNEFIKLSNSAAGNICELVERNA
jgi:hypothetical protein